MDGKSSSDDVSDRNEDQGIGNWSYSQHCYIIAKNMVAVYLCPIILWKAEFKSDKLGLAEEILAKY
jgi:hypothetical protein